LIEDEIHLKIHKPKKLLYGDHRRMTSFGTLEYVLDKFSGTWSWKVTGERAVAMVSRIIPKAWYGDHEFEAIIPDEPRNLQQIKWIMDRYPLEILSKNVWQRKLPPSAKAKPQKPKRTEKLRLANPGKQFKGTLFNFQREGLDFLIKSYGNALLADEMGLGKTIQSLAYLSTEKNAFPVLIVAPLVTLPNWQREIEKFLKRKSRNGRLLDNQPPTSTIIRVGKSEELGKYDFYIINYELLYKRYKDLAKLNLKTIVCDEVQHLRSKTTQKYHAIKKLAAVESVKYRIGLSGTPIYNRGSEIWPIVDILRPGLLGNFKEFCEYFCYINEKGKAIVLENKRESLRHMLQKHVMLRRKKSDVLSELKEKVRYKEVIDSDINYYNMELEKIWKKLEDERKEAQTAFDASSAYQRAIQSERQAAGVAKLPHVINFVKNIMEIEESVVVFCHHKAIHSLLHQSLAEFKPASIIGGQSDKERQQSIDSFQNGETKLMIAGLRAGNVGINLTRARYVIFAELDWSPAIHLQAEDRLHRIGQKNTVFAYYLIGNGTLDEHVAQVLVDKSYEIDSIMDNKAESFENREKAQLILAQIHDKVKSIIRN
jgi:SNF2 family DNA or RNA helicase